MKNLLFSIVFIVCILFCIGSSSAATVADALDNNKLNWTTDSGWRVQNTTTIDGVDALEAGMYYWWNSPKDYTLNTTVKGPGTIKFWWRQEAIGMGFGSVSFYDNSVEKAYISNNLWGQITYKVPTGTHILKWVFHNSGFYGGSGYSAFCRIDQVEWITADTIPPKVTSTNPNNLKTGFSRTGTITVKFTENIYSSTNFSKITVKNLATGKTITITKSLNGKNLYIKNSIKRSSNTWYQVNIPAAAVKDKAGNKLTKAYTFKFKTGA